MRPGGHLPEGESNPIAALNGKPAFTTTQWSVVLAACAGASEDAAAALEKLCRVYCYPLQAFVRRQGHAPEEAQDLTQGFFAHLLAGGPIQPRGASARSSLARSSISW